MEYRVTLGLGQDSLDAAALDGRAAALQEGLTEQADSSGAVVVVDLVKATVQLVLSVQAEDAVTATQRALANTQRGLVAAQLAAPASMVTIEAEAVPDPAQAHPLRPHAVTDA